MAQVRCGRRERERAPQFEPLVPLPSARWQPQGKPLTLKARQHAWYDLPQSPVAEQPLDGSSPRMIAMNSSLKKTEASTTGSCACAGAVVVALLAVSPMDIATRMGAIIRRS